MKFEKGLGQFSDAARLKCKGLCVSHEGYLRLIALAGEDVKIWY